MLQNYNYRARTTTNQVVTGIVQAVGSEAAKKILLQNHLTPLALTLQQGLLEYLPFFGKVNLKDKTLFARQLATMIDAGLTLSQALRLLTRQAKKGKFRQIMESVLSDLQDGFSFSTALSKYPEVFDPIFINVVKAGEATGKLETVLATLADNMEKDVKVRSKIKGALYYPIFILVAMVGVAIIMLTQVIPQLRSLFTEAGMTLPLSTRILMTASDLVVHKWPWLIVALIGSVVGLRFLFRTETGMNLFSKYILHIPVAGVIIEQSSMARFGRLLSLLLSSGVPLLEALRMIRDAFTNRIYQRGIDKVALQVERGIPMSVPILENPAFPVMVGQMVAVGEQTGKMDEVMLHVAQYFEAEVDAKVNGLATLIEPIVIVMLGIGVAWMLLAIILPIYQYSTSI